jgi:gelsolin
MYAKQERVPWQESNLSEIGSELDKKIREAAAEHEAAWNDLGQEAMLKVWRMEQFQVVEWPSSKHGRFHVGDSYLVLNSHEENDKLIHDVHIWIGAESSQDEYGTAAYKMVELDDSLGGVAIQHREVQGHESELFKSYFGTIMLLQGGVESGFTHVEPTVEEPHLYRIKGTEKSMRLTQMPVERASLNSGDCFILMLSPEQVFLWSGADSNPDERIRANKVAEGFCTEGTVVVLDQGAGDDEQVEDFWTVLGGYENDIFPATESDDDVTEFIPTLYQLGGETPEQIAQGQLIKTRFGKPTPKIHKSLLNPSNVYLLDSGWELFLWQGRDSDRSERLACMGIVDRYGTYMPRAKHLPVSIIKEGYETSMFESYFIEE